MRYTLSCLIVLFVVAQVVIKLTETTSAAGEKGTLTPIQEAQQAYKQVKKITNQHGIPLDKRVSNSVHPRLKSHLSTLTHASLPASYFELL